MFRLISIDKVYLIFKYHIKSSFPIQPFFCSKRLLNFESLIQNKAISPD